jgi:hypothetical protein
MSDGPHRSLPMRPGWKRAAERADTPAYSVTEVSDAICQAVKQDWRAEISHACVRRLGQIFNDQQLPLLGDLGAADFAILRRSLDGAGSLGGVLIDCAQEVLASGGTGAEGLREAIANALNDRQQRSARQIEECYLRNSATRGINMRERLAEAMSHASLDGILHRVLRIGDRPAARSSDKQQGLDDGVTLP